MAYKKNWRLERGLSALEMLVVLALTSILTSSAVLSYAELQASLNRNDARLQMSYDIGRAKASATESGGRAILAIEGGGTLYNVGVDEVPFNDPPDYDTFLFQRKLPEHISINSSQDLVFDSRGYLIDDTGELTTTSITLMENSASFYSVTIHPTGYVEVE